MEPFGGGASVLLRKPPSTYEVYNDLDSEVVNFFRVLREQEEEFFRAVALTPFSREEAREARNIVGDPVERARRLYILCGQTFGAGTTKSATGWRFGKRKISSRWDPPATWQKVDHLEEVISRLQLVQIENGAALDVIPRFDTKNTLFYVDPPYLFSTRTVHTIRKGYTHEMTDEEHWNLSITLNQVEGMVVLSGYKSPLYGEFYPGWTTVKRHTRSEKNKLVQEVLWISPRAEEERRRSEGVK